VTFLKENNKWSDFGISLKRWIVGCLGLYGTSCLYHVETIILIIIINNMCGGRCLFWLALLVVSLVDSEDEVLICNGDSYLHREFIKEMYKLYPIEPLQPECGSDKEGLEKEYRTLMGFCTVLADWTCKNPLNKRRDERLARCYKTEVRRLDKEMDLNLRIPLSNFKLPTDAYDGFYVNISTRPGATNEFVIKNSKSVTWRYFSLDKNSMFQEICSGENSVNCNSTIINLPEAFYTHPMQVGSNTFLSSGEVSMYPDVAYSDALQMQAKRSSGRLAKVYPILSKTRWGFVTNGCTAPYFKVKVKWTQIFTDPIKGYSVEPGTGIVLGRRLMSFDEGYGKYDHYYNNQTSKRRRLLATSPLRKTYACWKRQIVIEEVFDSGIDNMRCKLPFTTNQIRRKLATGKSAITVSENFYSDTWGVNNNGAFIVPFPHEYLLNIVECIRDGKVWKGFSETSPGNCAACATQILSAKNNLISRVCNMSNPDEATKECCFSCKPKYMPSGDVYPPVCVASCKPGQTFYPYQKCKACPVGTYSEGGLGSCKPCHELGYINARIIAGFGCQSCGLRAYASETQCIACGLGEFVPPPLGFTCTRCTEKGHYLPESGLATACTACDYGTYMDRNGITCSQCPQDTYNSDLASTSCKTCPTGTLSIPNRSTCVACPALDISRLPFAQYFEPGCRLQCNPTTSYVKTNPKSVGGCGRCEDVELPIGFYSEIMACSVGVRCTNGPLNSYYTSSAKYPSVQCGWQCIAGHNLIGGECVACVYDANTFNPEKHEHTMGCSYQCKQYLYREATLSCNQPCKDLIQEHGNNLIFGRVRDYSYSVTTRPNYILGVCGSEETVPRSDIPFMRLGRWAYLSPLPATTIAACGNLLLNVGEECDDGNTKSWDGCSSQCKIETGDYWDCDLIGAGCLPNCGWMVSNIEDWGISLEGYVLPPCSGGICNCANLLYYDVVRLPVGQRGIWMSNNLSPCGCGGNVLRTVPYSECTTLNKGCRLCSASQYHDDLLGMCVSCGSACSIGYTKKGQDVICGPTISTSYIDTSLSLTEKEELIGCKMCPDPTGLDLRFIQDDESILRKCRFICYKDTTGESRSLDTYCSVQTNTSLEADGECTGQCIKCSVSLDDLLLIAGNTRVGYYPKGCNDVVGYVWAPCDSDSKPRGSSFSTPSLISGARTGCAWVCNDGYVLSKGACVKCFQDSLATLPCISGEQTVGCGAGKLACVPCDGPRPFPLQVWVSSPPFYSSCTADCEVGISWGLGEGGGCEECSSYTMCELGELYVPCTTRSDSSCVSCSEGLSENSEYIAGGSCLTRCKSGYFMPSSAFSNSQCEVCVPLESCKPENGVRPSSTCIEPDDRNNRPSCESCNSNAAIFLQVGEAWSFVSPCVAVCVYGSVRRYSNNTCVPCSPSMCEKGQYGACNRPDIFTELTCTPCGAPASNSEYIIEGDCVQSCKDGYIEDESGICRLKRPVVVPVDSDVGNDTAIVKEALVYPTRTQRHSGMK
jgi:cysteine-rich repeat protein